MRCNLVIQSYALNKRVKRPGGSHEGVGRKKKLSQLALGVVPQTAGLKNMVCIPQTVERARTLNLGRGRSGKSHSARCCRAYVEWLKEERAKLGVGQPVAGRAQVEERSGPVIDSPVPSPSTTGDAGDVEDVVPVPGSIFNDEEVVTSEPVFDDAMGDVGPSGSGARASRKRAVPETETGSFW